MNVRYKTAALLLLCMLTVCGESAESVPVNENVTFAAQQETETKVITSAAKSETAVSS